MGQLDRLSAVDVAFLDQERGAAQRHIGTVIVCEGPSPGLTGFREHVGRRLDGLPRYRQRLLLSRLGARWVDDPNFDLTYHVRGAALPAPAGAAELGSFVGHLAGQRLDRQRPLWEAWLVEMGAEPGRFAVVCKHHLALVDGITGVDLATALLDREPTRADPRPGAEAGSERRPAWRPRPLPAPREVIAAETREALGSGLGLAGRAISAAVRPDRALREVAEVAHGIGELAWSALNPPPPSPLNVPSGPNRRYAVLSHRLADYTAVSDSFGAGVDEVLLTVLTGALRNWLRSRSIDVDGLELRALLPVLTSGPQQPADPAGRLSAMRVSLPVAISDPSACLTVLVETIAARRASSLTADATAPAHPVPQPPTRTRPNTAPPAPTAQFARAARIGFSPRMINLLITHVPGPAEPFSALGRRVEAIHPLPFLADGHGLAIGISRTDGGLHYGLLGDYDTLGDLDRISAGIEATLEELLAAGAAASAVRGSRRRRIDAEAAAAPAGDVEPVADITATPLMASTVKRRSGPGSDMRARHRERPQP
ncbi:wax ester/triacylglycerol synthase domain-containing protein [Conexibacter sp. DBS9H8]|uniref:wax ester/triacylglycerol synthase domain-containing protein n=1 Tax=Conexibacter sp. DBS9H8 TaxID=2937801 RepID=UPI00200D4FC6|nr:wax ester/triacylglycerol synthase domain-containing protein [Conexibacter sp. DBS9H8]